MSQINHNNSNSIIAEKYSEWVYKYRWLIILLSIIITALIGIGALKLRLNTSYRVWFNEGNQEVLDYDEFRNTFAQDDSLIVIFKQENTVFNNDTIAIIQRLTQKFWQTKYVRRVDSITNYSHTYVDEDGIRVQDLLPIKRPHPDDIKELVSTYLKENLINQPSFFSIKGKPLCIDLLADLLPYSKKQIKRFLNGSVSTEEMIDLTAETLRIKPHLNKEELSQFLKQHVSKNPQVIKRLLPHFFVTENEYEAFFLKYITDDPQKAANLAKTLIKTNPNLKDFLTPYLKHKKFTDLPYYTQWIYKTFPFLNRYISTYQIKEKLRHTKNKLPPNKEQIIKLIKPYIQAKDPLPILIEALQFVFPPYYEKETLKNWFLKPLTIDEYLNVFAEVLIARLPLTQSEVKVFFDSFVKPYAAQAQYDSLYARVSAMLFYSKNELQEKEKIALNEKLLKNLLISDDAKSTVILITPDLPDTDQSKTLDFLYRVKKILKAEEKRTGYQFHVAGLPEMAAAFTDYIHQDLNLLIPIMLTFILLTMLYLFKSFWGMMTPMLVVIFSVISTLGISGFIGIEMDNVTLMSPQVLMAIGIADSIHILSIFFRELHHGKPRKEAMKISLKKNLLPVFLTSITTTMGFLALLTSITPPIRVVGVMLAIGVCLAYILSVTLLPAMLAVIPFSAKRRHHNEGFMKKLLWLSGFVIRYRNKIIIVTTVITLGFSLFIINIKADNSPVKYFKKGTYFRDAMDFIDDTIEGAYNLEISIDTNIPDGIKDPRFLKKVEQLQNFLENEITEKYQVQITHTGSIVDIIKTINQRLKQNNPDFYKIPNNQKLLAENLFLYTNSLSAGRDLNNQINVEQSAIRLSVRRPTTSSEENLRCINIIRDYCDEHLKEYKVLLTGRASVFTYILPQVTISSVYGIIVALIVITIVITITFRSFTVGLLSLIPNIIPILLMFGLIGLTNVPFNLGLSMVAVVALGIVVDDTVHFITKFLQSRQAGYSITESVYNVFHDVGTAIIYTSVILTVGFGIFLFSSFGFNDRFGMFTAFTMIAAIIIDLVFLPAVLLLKAKKNESETMNLDYNNYK